jgi:hypothetical protein
MKWFKAFFFSVMAIIILNLIVLSAFLIIVLTGIISIGPDEDRTGIKDYTSYGHLNDREPLVVLFPTTDGLDPLTIEFSFRTVFGNSSTIDEFHLITGDGDHRSSSSDILHRYSHTGIYDIQYWVTFQNGNGSDHRYRTLNITGEYNSLPLPRVMETSINTTFRDQPLLLSGRGSYDMDGNVTGYFWVFGDGEYSDRGHFDGFNPGKIASHHYPRPGKYRVLLYVMDDKGFVNYPDNASTIMVSVSPSSEVHLSPWG